MYLDRVVMSVAWGMYNDQGPRVRKEKQLLPHQAFSWWNTSSYQPPGLEQLSSLTHLPRENQESCSPRRKLMVFNLAELGFPLPPATPTIPGGKVRRTKVTEEPASAGEDTHVVLWQW